VVGKDSHKPNLDAHTSTRNWEVHNALEKSQDSLPRRKRLSRSRTVRRRASWLVAQTQTLMQEIAKEVSS